MPDDNNNQDPLPSGCTPAQFDAMFKSVQDELRAMAYQCMAAERAGHTLQATALVNEAYLRLRNSRLAAYNDSRHVFQVAATTLGRLLIEHARSRNRVKRGGGLGPKLSLDEASVHDHSSAPELTPEEIVQLSEALDSLAVEDDRMAAVVKLRVIQGLSMAQIAKALGCSERVVFSDWKFAKARLRRFIDESGLHLNFE
ncbi:MAG: ECF-type sigma factor [Phycisphaerales bacterium]